MTLHLHDLGCFCLGCWQACPDAVERGTQTITGQPGERLAQSLPLREMRGPPCPPFSRACFPPAFVGTADGPLTSTSAHPPLSTPGDMRAVRNGFAKTRRPQEPRVAGARPSDPVALVRAQTSACGGSDLAAAERARSAVNRAACHVGAAQGVSASTACACPQDSASASGQRGPTDAIQGVIHAFIFID